MFMFVFIYIESFLTTKASYLAFTICVAVYGVVAYTVFFCCFKLKEKPE